MDVVESPVRANDVNATILHRLGHDYKRLTCRYQRHDFRLTDIQGEIVRPLFRNRQVCSLRSFLLAEDLKAG